MGWLVEGRNNLRLIVSRLPPKVPLDEYNIGACNVFEAFPLKYNIGAAIFLRHFY
jgi:hypothetical protein